MNPRLDALHPYPFERLRALLSGVTPPAGLAPIRLSIGEPQHPTPAFIGETLTRHLDGLSTYPTTAGMDTLREAIARWCARRFGLTSIDPGSHVLPVAGTREALFAVAQAVIDGSRPSPLVACPNPFYQIYEGAALLAGATPVLLNQTEANGFGLELDTIADADWARVQLLYVCSPGNPTGRVLSLDDWRRVFEYADRHDVVIASDECYTDIYPDEAQPPLGGLQAAQQLGRHDYRNLVVFVSLSKRSNAPGLRSGAVAGDARLIECFLRYRTYHGCALGPAVQHASIAAWNDEAHVIDNRAKYRSKFADVVPIVSAAMPVCAPDAGFYLWAPVPGGDDEAFVRTLYGRAGVTVLPGSYLGREAHGCNPGRGYVRVALAPEYAECLEGARRMAACAADYRPLA